MSEKIRSSKKTFTMFTQKLITNKGCMTCAEKQEMQYHRYLASIHSSGSQKIREI